MAAEEEGPQHTELTQEEKDQALHAARSGMLDLIAENPALALRIGADDLVKVYLAGVRAGAEASARVFHVVSRDFLDGLNEEEGGR